MNIAVAGAAIPRKPAGVYMWYVRVDGQPVFGSLDRAEANAKADEVRAGTYRPRTDLFGRRMIWK